MGPSGVNEMSSFCALWITGGMLVESLVSYDMRSVLWIRHVVWCRMPAGRVH